MSEHSISSAAFGRPIDRGTWMRRVTVLVFIALAALLPMVATEAVLLGGIAVFAAAIAIIGLNLLSGSAGQLSLGHAFFSAVGAYSFAFYSGASRGVVVGLGLPPLLGLLLAVLTAGIAGLLFSPISSRLRGLSLGIASLGLVFVGNFVLTKATAISGGHNGRDVPRFEIAGFVFGDDTPYLNIMGVQFEQAHRVYLLALVLLVVAGMVAHNLMCGRTGRAFEAIRDGETSAAVSGVNVKSTKRTAFIISSMFAGLGGVVMALGLTVIVPGSFTLLLSINFLAAVFIGGAGSLLGSLLGAGVVFALPLFLAQFGGQPILGVNVAALPQYIFGLALILVLIFEPNGLAQLVKRVLRRFVPDLSTASSSTPEDAEPTGTTQPSKVDHQ